MGLTRSIEETPTNVSNIELTGLGRGFEPASWRGSMPASHIESINAEEAGKADHKKKAGRIILMGLTKM